MAFVAALLTCVGAILGAIGASSLYWRKSEEEKDLLQASVPSGTTLNEQVENWQKATYALNRRAEWRDKLTLWGWACVIVGAVLAMIVALSG